MTIKSELNKDKLKSFFESNSLSASAAESLKDGREIELTIVGGQTSQPFTFTKIRGKNSLLESASKSPDLKFSIPELVAQELVTQNFESIAQVGIFIFQNMLTSDSNRKIKAKVNTGIISMMTGGYFGILTSGGTEVMKFLATKGFSNIGKIKDAISRLKT